MAYNIRVKFERLKKFLKVNTEDLNYDTFVEQGENLLIEIQIRFKFNMNIIF